MKANYLLSFALLCLELGTAGAQYTLLHSFNDTNGGNPTGTLTLSGNMLFGVAGGGEYDSGCIFSIDTAGNGYRVLYNFNGATGMPANTLALSGNLLYGATEGGANHAGSIFSINTNGTGYRDVFDFDSADGSFPCPLTLLENKLFGITTAGGRYNDGLIYSIDTGGSGYKDLFDFNGTNANGGNPWGPLIFSPSGKVFYGTTINSDGDAVVFSIDTNGTGYKKLYNSLRSYEESLLALSGNKLYWIHATDILSVDTNGNGYAVLFDSLNLSGIGAYVPNGTLTPSGNTLVGMSVSGGADRSGYIFSIDTNGTEYTDILEFNGANGATPSGSGLLTISGDIMYGMTYYGGTYFDGVIFSYKQPGLGINQIPPTQDAFNTYPNPSTGKFTIQSSGSSGQWAVSVYNVLGQKVYFNHQITKSSNYQIDLSSQPNGVYFYRVVSESGELIGEGKLIITN